MQAARVKDFPGIALRERLCAERCRGRLTDTNKGPCASGTSPFHHRVHIVCERGIREMDVTIGEDCRAHARCVGLARNRARVAARLVGGGHRRGAGVTHGSTGDVGRRARILGLDPEQHRSGDVNR